ncbi:WXG100 family type VII secretion target [Couchioplanes caeruleus]|uniref:WXG100 family type VII secretion target n=2 Tax=Couchioplanes caeruleus TaxID=56438 RepID=A0A1K0GIY2_9ACTN|nr:hypothetical protein [Couchioplanes caeruleus]OJF10892.1 hypothetical protein BG844_29570 [Couchioplanes caeruleus subsp. caeruleus]ROP29860.1 hypothetical protein EDD30_2681 [Couchioplanes caeruleus]
MSYRTNYAAAEQAGTELVDACQKIHLGVEELLEYCMSHLQEWTGEAQSAYGPVQAKWTGAQGKMGQHLVVAEQILAKIHADIRDGDVLNANRWNDTKVGF